MKINEEIARELALGYSGGDENGTYVYVDKQFENEGRWSAYYTVVFMHDGELYGFDYEEGLTEMQEGTDPFWPDADGNIEAYPVKGREITKIVYDKVRQC